MEEKRSRAYQIPANIFDGPSLFGIPARNWIEASVLSFIPGLLFWNFVNFKDMSIKIILMVVLCLPLGAVALIGYNGESLTQFLRTYIRFRRNRRILEYRMDDEEGGGAERSAFADLEDKIAEL